MIETDENQDSITAVCGADFATKKELCGIEVSEPPTRTKYMVGESFDPTGMKINKIYTDDSEEETTNYTISPEVLSIDDTEVIIKVSEDGKEFETSQEIVQGRRRLLRRDHRH